MSGKHKSGRHHRQAPEPGRRDTARSWRDRARALRAATRRLRPRKGPA
jgi:hypothetical protein